MGVVSPKLQERYTKWWRGELDGPIIQLSVEKKPCSWDAWRLAHNYDDVDGVLDAHEAYLAHVAFELDAFPQFDVNLGPGIVGAALGAGVTVKPDTVWLLKEPRMELDEEIAWDFSREWFVRCLAIAERAAQRGKDAYAVGIPSHSGSLDLLSFLRHSGPLLVDMKLEPERVEDWMRAVTRFWLESYWKFHEAVSRHQDYVGTSMHIWAPGSWSYIQADVAAMISPADFARFVVPDLAQIAADLDFTVYHLDGPGQIPHVDLLLAMPDLDAIQWIPGAGQDGPEAPKWYPLLRKIQAASKRLVLLDIEPASIPRLFDNISPRNVLIQTHSRDRRDVSRVGRYVT